MNKNQYEIYFDNGEATFREIALLRLELSKAAGKEGCHQKIQRLINAIENLDANQALFLKELKLNDDIEAAD